LYNIWSLKTQNTIQSQKKKDDFLHKKNVKAGADKIELKENVQSKNYIKIRIILLFFIIFIHNSYFSVKENISY
jgi:hypothetical protein